VDRRGPRGRSEPSPPLRRASGRLRRSRPREARAAGSGAQAGPPSERPGGGANAPRRLQIARFLSARRAPEAAETAAAAGSNSGASAGTDPARRHLAGVPAAAPRKPRAPHGPRAPRPAGRGPLPPQTVLETVSPLPQETIGGRRRGTNKQTPAAAAGTGAGTGPGPGAPERGGAGRGGRPRARALCGAPAAQAWRAGRPPPGPGPLAGAAAAGGSFEKLAPRPPRTCPRGRRMHGPAPSAPLPVRGARRPAELEAPPRRGPCTCLPPPRSATLSTAASAAPPPARWRAGEAALGGSDFPSERARSDGARSPGRPSTFHPPRARPARARAGTSHVRRAGLQLAAGEPAARGGPEDPTPAPAPAEAAVRTPPRERADPAPRGNSPARGGRALHLEAVSPRLRRSPEPPRRRSRPPPGALEWTQSTRDAAAPAHLVRGARGAA
jgi:hypothetical protein